jgi:hypothetical protein
MIETETAQWVSANNIAIAHNNVTVINKDDGGPLNPFQMSQDTGGPEAQNEEAVAFQNVAPDDIHPTRFFKDIDHYFPTHQLSPSSAES